MKGPNHVLSSRRRFPGAAKNLYHQSSHFNPNKKTPIDSGSCCKIVIFYLWVPPQIS
jgi:hypothetical protein